MRPDRRSAPQSFVRINHRIKAAQRDVQRIRTRQWLAERWDQKTYGLQKAQQITINVQDLRMAALRHVEVIDDLSTEKSQ